MNKITMNRNETIALPDVLAGTRTPAEWMNRRRKEVLKKVGGLLYGEFPERPERIEFHEIRRKTVFQEKAVRREMEIVLAGNGKVIKSTALWYAPLAPGKHPVVCELNFKGNAACTMEEDIPLGDTKIRGEQIRRWPFESIVSQGVAVVTACYNDFFPDRTDGLKDSIYTLIHPEEELKRRNRDFTAIGAWAFAKTVLLELALTDSATDPSEIWVHGHSRLGKTALWAGANDLRFAGIISNDSGCCGAALSREKQGEDLAAIVKQFPHWFRQELDAYANREEKLELDQHWLLSLAAPRPLMVASAEEDLWADPFNEYRALKAVNPVYELFGAKGLGNASFPSVNHPLFGDRTAYCMRTGPHDVLPYDWEQVLHFIKQQTE